MVKEIKKTKTAYLAAEGFEKELEKELKGVVGKYGRLYLTDIEEQQVFWAQNIWLEPILSHFESISEASTLLRSIQRNWTLYSFVEHRRAALIKAKLPYISEKRVVFGSKINELEIAHQMGSWTLLDRETLLASPRCSSPFGNGVIHFEESKVGPPSRAYLKLYEALTFAQKMPDKTSKCLEIGASPGGWTYVLAKLGATVISVDRSELAPNVAKMEGVHFVKGDAFSMLPTKIGALDWIFSDVACYPEKLLEWVLVWIASGMCKNFVCTLKFQGDQSTEIVKEFLKIKGSVVRHLGYNKHELTWMLLQD